MKPRGYDYRRLSRGPLLREAGLSPAGERTNPDAVLNGIALTRQDYFATL